VLRFVGEQSEVVRGLLSCWDVRKVVLEGAQFRLELHRGPLTGLLRLHNLVDGSHVARRFNRREVGLDLLVSGEAALLCGLLGTLSH